MPRGRSEHDSYLAARVPHALTRAIDVIAERDDISFSEAVRYLLVQGLENIGYRETVTDSEGTREDDSWRGDPAS